jgi:tetratricopeptide (TPR) repeat protein
MSVEFYEKARHIFPRWRSFQSTASLGELTWPPVQEEFDTSELDISLANAIAEWKADPSLWKGLDLLGTATIANRLDDFAGLVAEVRNNPLTPGAARAFFGESHGPPQLEPSGCSQLSGEAFRAEVKLHRQKVASTPHDPVEWVELARAFTIAGQNEKARRAILGALQLAPNNRFVLRSAARFFIHVGEPDIAQALLGSAQSLRQDPWLMASEIAIAGSLGTSSRHIRAAREKLGGDVPASELTELAAALGTLEAESGSHRIARRLLRRSLEQANENSVAQIRWLNRTHLGEAVDVSNVRPPLLHEANAKASFYSGDFETARDEAFCWLEDQPFASAPAIMSSYILADVFMDWEGGRRIAERGLVSNQDDTGLLNNLAVCLMELGEMTKAEEVVDRLRAAERGATPYAIRKATYGMLAFRKGDPDSGRRLYLEAIEGAKLEGLRPTAARAAFHLAIEELVAGTDQSEPAVKRISQLDKADEFVESARLLSRVVALLKMPERGQPDFRR